jgi:HEPN domain-containing protein
VPKRYSPEDPREWLNRARSNLALAKAKRKGVYLEDLCFDAQQAAEKAIKAVLIKVDVDFPYAHDLAELLHYWKRVVRKSLSQSGKQRG